LGLNTAEAIENYIKDAPASAKTWLVGKGYDKTHVRWHSPNKNSKFGKEPLPEAGTGTGIRYAKKLTQSDSTYFQRPSDWRCTRRHSPKGCADEGITQAQNNIAQYEYKPGKYLRSCIIVLLDIYICNYIYLFHVLYF
jgi:hypothetical protein